MHLLLTSLLTLLLLLPADGLAAADAEEQRSKLDALRSRISGLRTEMQSKSGEKTELSRLLQESEQHIGRLARKLRVLDGRLSRQGQRLQGLRDEQLAQRRSLDEQRGGAGTPGARRLRDGPAGAPQDPARPAGPGDCQPCHGLLRLSQPRARQRMRAIRQHMQRLADTEHEILDEETQLAVLQQEQQAELDAMQRLQDERKDVVAQLTEELNDQGRQLDRLQSDERDLKTLISGLEEALADIPAEDPQQLRFAGLRGRLPWPAQGRIANRFGAPKLGSLVWDGVMISAPEGREVRAVHHGRVAFADWLRGFGLLLIVDHGDGYMTLYGHNQSLFKEAGDWVDVNEPVALVGSSGGREQAGVYFGIRHQGRAVDPARWCRRPTGRKVG